MSVENLPNQNNDQYDPNLEAQDEEVASGGSNKLFYALGALILALVLGYVVLPKGQGSGLSSVTPTFMLDDASVTATAPTAADSIAAGLKVAPVAADETTDADDAADAKPTVKPAVPGRPAPAAPVATDVPVPVAPVAPVLALGTAPVAPVAAPAEPAPAPSNVTLTGRIEDENGRPLVGATVLLRGSSKGTSTDANGNYTMEVPSSTDNTLVYGYGGYEDEIVRARGSQPVNITLAPRAKSAKKRR